MSHTATVAGVRFTSDVELFGLDDDFFDVETAVHWTTEPPSAERLTAPDDLELWIDAETVTLPIIHEKDPVKTWQVRQVAPIVAAWHGKLSLHASAVAIGDGVVAFVGPTGAGKSTLAWELVKAGADPVADDVLPIRFPSDRPSVGGGNPLAMVCFLERGATMSAEPVPDRDALGEHLAHGFGEHGDGRIWSEQFDAYHRIVQAVPHARLTVPDTRSALTVAAPAIVDRLSVSVP